MYIEGIDRVCCNFVDDVYDVSDDEDDESASNEARKSSWVRIRIIIVMWVFEIFDCVFDIIIIKI